MASLLAGLAALAGIDAWTIEQRSLASTLSLYRNSSETYLTEAGRQRIGAEPCEYIQRKARYFDYQAVECRTDTVCGSPVNHIFLYSRVSGAFLGPDPFAARFARRCPAMLTDEALASVKLGQGG